MKKTLHATLALLFVTTIFGCTTTTMVRPGPINVPDSLSQQQVSEAVEKALLDKGWILTAKTADSYQAQLSGGGWQVTIRTLFNTRNVEIQYIKSRGLKYKKEDNGEETINRHWNSWMIYLTHAIKDNLSRELASD